MANLLIQNGEFRRKTNTRTGPLPPCHLTETTRPPHNWTRRKARTDVTDTNAIERLHEEFKRRIKTQTVLPSAETAAILFWALMAFGQITMRKVDGWQTLAEPLDAANTVDLAA